MKYHQGLNCGIQNFMLQIIFFCLKFLIDSNFQVENNQKCILRTGSDLVEKAFSFFNN